jgi:plastocyanin
MISIVRRATALAATLALTAACGGAAAPTPAPATNIDIAGRAFPANTDVAKGTKVTWSNKDTSSHTVTSGTRPTKDGKFDSGQLATNASFSFTFADAGTFQYFCTNHSGMQGTITVK